MKRIRREIRHLREIYRGDYRDYTRGYRRALKDIEDVIKVIEDRDEWVRAKAAMIEDAAAEMESIGGCQKSA